MLWIDGTAHTRPRTRIRFAGFNALEAPSGAQLRNAPTLAYLVRARKALYEIRGLLEFQAPA
jgi:hypothetical protein